MNRYQVSAIGDKWSLVTPGKPAVPCTYLHHAMLIAEKRERKLGAGVSWLLDPATGIYHGTVIASKGSATRDR